MKSGCVEIDGHLIQYYQNGERGSRIVLLHGYGPFTHSLNFRNFLENMSGTYQILALDLLAHGKSSNPTSPIGFEEHARILHQAAVELGYNRYTLIGYSFGGWISMRLASKFSENIEKLVIVDIVPRTYEKPQQVTGEPGIPYKFKDTNTAVDWISNRYPDTPRDFWQSYLENLFYRDENNGWSMSSHPSRKTQLVMDGNGWRYIQSIKVHSLLVRGSGSHLVDLGSVDKMKEVMDDLLVVTIEGADHNLPFTHSDEFEVAIRDFIPV